MLHLSNFSQIIWKVLYENGFQCKKSYFCTLKWFIFKFTVLQNNKVWSPQIYYMQCGSWLSIALTFIYYALTLLSLLLYAKSSLLYITRQTDLELSFGCTNCCHWGKRPDINQTEMVLPWPYYPLHLSSKPETLSAIKGQNLAYLQGNSCQKYVTLLSPTCLPQSHLQFYSSFLMVPHEWEILIWK